MTDLEARFRSLAQTPAPDLWSDIDRREPAGEPAPSERRRVAAAALAVVVGTAGVGTAIWAFGRDAGRPTVADTPDGVIAFTSGIGGYHIATVTLDGVVTDLTDPTGNAYDLGSAWAPTGDAIAFLRYAKGTGEGFDYRLVIADADGRVVADFDPPAVGYSWSPDGSQIAFSTFRERTDHDIAIAARNGSGTRIIVDSPRSDASPAWSPTGDLIAFTSGPVFDRDAGDEDIYVVRPDGTGLTRLTGPGPDGEPVWSPDGGRIAFVGARGGGSEIFVMNADGSGRVAVTDAPTKDVTSPVWSPDGSRIAFGLFSGSDWDVYVVDADGTDQIPLAAGPNDEVGPAWAADGSFLAYSVAESSEACGCDNAGTFDIFAVRPDGTGRRRLTHDAGELGGDLAWKPSSATPPSP
jgi:Tol biopolymer transport system component